MIESITVWTVDNFLPAFTAAALVTLLTLLFRKQILVFVKKSYYWIDNKPINASIKLVDKYDSEAEQGLDKEFFSNVKEQSGVEVHSPEYHQNDVLKFQAENTPIKIAVRLEKVLNFNQKGGVDNQLGDDGPAVTGSKLLIESDPELQFGYRDESSLKEFEKIAETVSRVANNRCFPGESPAGSHSIGRVTKGIPPGASEIEDEALGFSATIRDSELRLQVSEPQNLRSGIHKYFRPFGGKFRAN